MMVSIPLDAKTVLTSDTRQWILLIDGRASSFYATIEGAITSYYNMKLRSSEAKSMNTLLLRQKELLTRLNKALTPLQITVGGAK